MIPVGQVNAILTQSLVDGPGNRAVVFLQGCTMNCLYCHNPYTRTVCNHCGDCISACPLGALSKPNGHLVLDPSRCDGCDLCVVACPNGSSPRAQSYTVDALWEQIRPLTAFLSGVSVSGGEPTQQSAFVAAFFARIKAESQLSTLVESNGDAGPADWERLLPVLDHALIDLKAADDARYETLTGRSGVLTRRTIQRLAEAGKLLAVRQVVVPEHTDSIESAVLTASFLAAIDPAIPLIFLRFRPHGTRGAAQQWQSPPVETLDALVVAAQGAGLKSVRWQG